MRWLIQERWEFGKDMTIVFKNFEESYERKNENICHI
jgi:hypothetical protein